MRTFAALIVLALLAAPAPAVEPDEVLPDKELEARAREISQNLRCLVCQNESVDGSNAPLARDLRILVREQLTAGATDSEVFEFVVERYGEFVLLKPDPSGSNLLIYAAGPATLALAAACALIYARRRRGGRTAAPLSPAEQNKVAEILRSGPQKGGLRNLDENDRRSGRGSQDELRNNSI